jgi:hypothetical protein
VAGGALDHEKAGVRVRRAQALAAAVVAVVLVGGAAYADRELGRAEIGAGAAATSASGEWFCPHGGGESGWTVTLQIANPGERPATVRVRFLGSRRAPDPETMTVDPGALLTVPAPADGRGRASMVEWFDQWVAVGWIAHAGGGEGGVAAEPCAPAAGDRWLLPDGTTETERDDDSVVVMNPFARAAVFSLTLLSERRDPVVHSDLTNIELKPFRSRAVALNEYVKGERTVATLLEVSVGRVAAATLGVATDGGIRSAVGYLGAASDRPVFPGAGDAGRTELATMNASQERVPLEGALLDREAERVFAGLADSPPPGSSGRTFPATTAGATSVVLAADGPGVAAVRRTFGVTSDQAATNGAEPAPAWVILPTVAGDPSHLAIALATPGDEDVRVTLAPLGANGVEPVEVSVPASRTTTAPKEFVQAVSRTAVVAVSDGTFVPASASYSFGREGFATYAVALGIPIPAPWVPG